MFSGQNVRQPVYYCFSVKMTSEKKKTYLLFVHVGGSHARYNCTRLLKLTSTIAILVSYLDKKFEVNRTRNKQGCQ